MTWHIRIWCLNHEDATVSGLELALARVPGVLSTEVGYTQGRTADPTYQVSAGVLSREGSGLL